MLTYGSTVVVGVAVAIGALQSCPTDVVNVLLDLIYLDFHIKYRIPYSAVRCPEYGCWSANFYSHCNVLDEVP